MSAELGWGVGWVGVGVGGVGVAERQIWFTLTSRIFHLLCLVFSNKTEMKVKNL